jgi:hypothetical protein
MSLTEQQNKIWQLFRYRPAEIGRICGFKDLTDELHGEWMKKIIYGDADYTLQAHRLSYKSSCLSVAIAIWLTLNHGKNAIFARKTDNDVAESIAQAAKVFDNEVFRELCRILLGAPVDLIKRTNNELTTNLYDAPRGSSQLVGVGIGGSLTGKHADLIICDDVINLQDRISKAERERTKSVIQELRNIVTRDGRIVMIGTPWHKEDGFSIVKPAEMFDCYSTGLITPEKLEEIKRSMAPSLFAANYELKHIAADGALFDTQPQWTDDAELLRDGIAHIDAAYGGEDWTAFTCARRDGDTIYMYGRAWQKHIDKVLDACVGMADDMMCAPIWCENNGDKGYLGKEIRAAGHEAHIYSERQNKYVKISSYLRKWWKNIVWIKGTDKAYIDQIMDYTEDAAHDDCPDSAATCCRILDRDRINLL